PGQGIDGAIGCLEHVSPMRSKPWKLPPVKVEIENYRFHIRQGATDGPTGFVHAGDSIEMISHDVAFHAIHADGAQFWSLMFPDPDQPLSRTLSEPGVIELSSAAGYVWMHA